MRSRKDEISLGCVDIILNHSNRGSARICATNQGRQEQCWEKACMIIELSKENSKRKGELLWKVEAQPNEDVMEHKL